MNEKLAPYALNLSQPDFWNKPDPAMDPTWSRAANLQARPPARGPGYWLLDGPPYANGELHLGHLLNKFLKDACARRKLATGAVPVWRAGWDCHGLPLELATQKRPGSPPRKTPQFLGACRKEASHWMARQTETFSALGTMLDLDDPWSTMDPARESKALGLLRDLWKAGLLVERGSPTHWCPVCQSALAASELEKGAGPKKSLFAWTPFKERSASRLLGALGLAPPTQRLGLAYWTTTPWTLPANQAFAFPSAARFSLCRLQGGATVLVESSAQERLAPLLGAMQALASLPGTQLNELALMALTPLGGREVPVSSAPFASASEGTGFVHVAPAFGPEDYEWAESRDDLSLDLSCPMGPDGKYGQAMGEFSSLDRDGANAKASGQLREAGLILLEDSEQGEAQNCWRHGVAVFHRASRQWALDLDAPVPGDEHGSGMRQRALDSMDSMSFLPSDKPKNALRNMLAGRRFWTLSRDRSWGLPLPFLRKADGSLSEKTEAWWDQAVRAVAEGGVEAYAIMEPPAGLTKDAQCVDVWFDSGAAFETASELGFERPSLVVEGADQTRGWFLSSMLLNAFRTKGAAFEQILCHGFVVDEKGQKLAKSKGNAPDTSQLLAEHGADALRMWSLSQTVGQEVVWSKASLASAKGELRDWRNFLRFLLAQSAGVHPPLRPSPQSALDHMALREHAVAAAKWAEGFDRGEPHLALAGLADFRRFASSNLFELAKRDLYCAPASDAGAVARREFFAWLLAQWLLLLDPFMPLSTAQAASLGAPKEKSVAYGLFDAKLADQAKQALTWREAAHKRLEKERADRGDSKAKFLVRDEFSSLAESILGTPREHLVRGLAFDASSTSPEWERHDPWECHRCRGLFVVPPRSERDGGDWDFERFGKSLCDLCRSEEL